MTYIPVGMQENKTLGIYHTYEALA